MKNPKCCIYSYSIIAEFFPLCLKPTNTLFFSYRTFSPELFTGAPAPRRLSCMVRCSACVLSIHHCLFRVNGITGPAELLGQAATQCRVRLSSEFILSGLTSTLSKSIFTILPCPLSAAQEIGVWLNRVSA